MAKQKIKISTSVRKGGGRKTATASPRKGGSNVARRKKKA